jgi:hypothetical protein
MQSIIVPLLSALSQADKFGTAYSRSHRVSGLVKSGMQLQDVV